MMLKPLLSVFRSEFTKRQFFIYLAFDERFIQIYCRNLYAQQFDQLNCHLKSCMNGKELQSLYQITSSLCPWIHLMSW